MICALSVMAVHCTSTTTKANHFCVLFDLESEDEVRGIGHRIAEKEYPLKDGWQHRIAVTSNILKRDDFSIA